MRRIVGTASTTRTNRWRAAILAAALSGLAMAACGDDGGKSPPAELPVCPAAEAALPGMRTGEAPWPAELEHLGERLDQIGLPRLTQEGSALDLHVQLSVEVDGDKVKVPSSIGLNGEEATGGRMVSGFVSAIHTHDDSGLVHVHSPEVRPYTLGQLFDVWGVTLTQDRIGGYCAGGGRRLNVESNGKEITGDPREVPLEDGQRISVAYGDD